MILPPDERMRRRVRAILDHAGLRGHTTALEPLVAALREERERAALLCELRALNNEDSAALYPDCNYRDSLLMSKNQLTRAAKEIREDPKLLSALRFIIERAQHAMREAAAGRPTNV